MALKIVRRYDANGRELTEKDLETFRLDSPVVREILANLNREVAEGIRQKIDSATGIYGILVLDDKNNYEGQWTDGLVLVGIYCWTSIWNT
ncbi:hypothetical protein [Hominiventricola aquisgranensis]|uniref:DUF4258 domain-containing protein n=1 Tax=Hominiventricola aquisgranensis TaxID=3133164 RepID=A0ABV1I4P1_9FIRM